MEGNICYIEIELTCTCSEYENQHECIKARLQKIRKEAVFDFEKYDTEMLNLIHIKDKKINDLSEILENQRKILYETMEIYENKIKNINSEQVSINSTISINTEYHPEPLVLKEGYQLEHREEDGYINVTNLCKAGKKLYSKWRENKRTAEFLEVLVNSDPRIRMPDDLIKSTLAPNGKYHTWVHPYVAINIAQWISPEFNFKVATWVYEIMLTGKVDITKTKPYQELQAENKEQEIKINKLTKRYVRKQKRVQYEQNNVIYILTTKNLKSERRYILGKAENLTSRLSTYNKTDEHEVIYYQECQNKDILSAAEILIFCKLEKYREQANRERFILPENENIDLFINTVKNIISKIND